MIEIVAEIKRNGIDVNYRTANGHQGIEWKKYRIGNDIKDNDATDDDTYNNVIMDRNDIRDTVNVYEFEGRIIMIIF